MVLAPPAGQQPPNQHCQLGPPLHAVFKLTLPQALAGFLSALHSFPQLPKLAPLFLQISAQTLASLAEPPFGHPVSTTTHVLGTLCAFNLLYYYFFQTTCHHPKFYFLYILCSYLLITHHPREFCERARSGVPLRSPSARSRAAAGMGGALSTQL